MQDELALLYPVSDKWFKSLQCWEGHGDTANAYCWSLLDDDAISDFKTYAEAEAYCLERSYI